MKSTRRASALVFLVATLLAPALVFVSTGPAGSQESDPTAKLGIWAGRWTYHAKTYETPYSHAYAYDGTADCNWSPNHGFMVCDFLNRDPEPGSPVNDLVIFSYDPVTKAYTRVGVFKESKPFPQSVTVDGNTWTTSAEIPYKGKTIIYRDVYVFQSSSKRTTTAQISADKGKTWTIVTEFTAEQVSS
jgi:Protein of unknown function (DUF1579)